VPAPPMNAPPVGFEAPRAPEPRSFDFGQPASPPPPPSAPPRDAAPVPAPVVVREPAPSATASEPREWTPTPPTDVTAPRNEP
jgi:hypothetical protein